MASLPAPVRNAPEHACFVCLDVEKGTASELPTYCAGGCGLLCHSGCEGLPPLKPKKRKERPAEAAALSAAAGPATASEDATTPPSAASPSGGFEPGTPSKKASSSDGAAAAPAGEGVPTLEPHKLYRWGCPRCTLINTAAAKKCKVCELPNPQIVAKPKPSKAVAPPAPAAPPLPPPPTFAQGNWKCARCSAMIGQRVYAREDNNSFFSLARVVARDRHGQIKVEWDEDGSRDDDSRPPSAACSSSCGCSSSSSSSCSSAASTASSDISSTGSGSAPSGGSGGHAGGGGIWISERHAALADKAATDGDVRTQSLLPLLPLLRPLLLLLLLHTPPLLPPMPLLRLGRS